MTKVRRAFNGISVAAVALVASAMSVFGIQELIEKVTGWYPPKWIAVIILGLGTAGAIVAALATFGVTIPLWLAKILAVATSIAA